MHVHLSDCGEDERTKQNMQQKVAQIWLDIIGSLTQLRVPDSYLEEAHDAAVAVAVAQMDREIPMSKRETRNRLRQMDNVESGYGEWFGVRVSGFRV